MSSASGRSSAEGEGLSPRDQAVLRTVGSLRLATGGQLQRLFFAEPDSGSANPRIARRCLQRLTDQRLLLRLERRVGGVRAGSSSFVYALSPRGGRAVGVNIGRGRQREPSLTFAVHTLAVAETCVRLHEARRAGRLNSLHIEVEPACWRSLGGLGELGVSRLKPDLFILAALGDHEHLAFVEVDQGSEHGPAIRRKADVYERYFRSGREQARLGTFPRVVWLALDPRRCQRLQTVLSSDRGLTPALHRVGLQADPLGALLGDDAAAEDEGP